MKSLSEDGFRTYGGAGSVTLVNCTAVNTRAGFEYRSPGRRTDQDRDRESAPVAASAPT